MIESKFLILLRNSHQNQSFVRVKSTTNHRERHLRRLILKPFIILLVASSCICKADLLGANQSKQTANRPEESCRIPQLVTGQQSNGQRNNSNSVYREPQQTKIDHGLSHEKVLNLQVGRDIFTQNQLDKVNKILFQPDEFHNQSSISSFNLYALTAKAHGMVYNDLLSHRYDSFNELWESTGPEVDQNKCIAHLSELVERLQLAAKEKYSSRDVNLHQLLDTFGRVPPGLLMGSLSWPGMYEECLRLKIITKANERLDTRYCLAFMRHKQWSKGTPFSAMLTIGSGICLPKSCDSLRYKNKYQLIQQLFEFNARTVDKNEMEINDIYCSPDANSPLRAWWKSPKALQAAAALTLWISILIYATIKYELSMKKPTSRAKEFEKLASNSSIDSEPSDLIENSKQDQQVEKNGSQVYKMLSLTYNLELLFGMKSSNVREISETEPKKNTLGEQQQTSGEPIIDLRCLEGIKVICMLYLIMGHMLMCLTSMVSNGRALAFNFSPAFLLANMMPAFAVNSFFTITGILTSYLMFKQNKSHSFIASPVKWMVLMIYRYLRIMPMYLIVVYYSKYLAKYMGSGPAWDYGTSSLAPRRRCEQESWLWTLMFGANFKHPLEHCVPSAWYLANDFQFFMVTPIFLVTLHKKPRFGQYLLKAGIVAGYLAGIWNISASSAEDLRPVARFSPHGFKTYVTFLHDAYTWPMYRIPAYLCGLLFGYLLYTYEQNKLKFRDTVGEKPELRATLQEPGWSPIFIKNGTKLSLVFVIFCALVPIVGLNIPLNRLFSKLMVAFIMSTNHIIVALAAGFYILLATTGYGGKYLKNFLSASIFRSLGRLSLCVALINVEVCYYLILNHKQPKYVDFMEQTALNLLGIVVSYSAAFVMYLLFEAPMKAAMNNMIAKATVKVAESKRKVA